MVRMLASRCRMLNRRLSSAVTEPATAPAKIAARVASQGLTPWTISVAQTAAPSGKLPSTVRSGKFNTRNERNTPSPTSPNTRPISIAPRNWIRDIKEAQYCMAWPSPALHPLNADATHPLPLRGRGEKRVRCFQFIPSPRAAGRGEGERQCGAQDYFTTSFARPTRSLDSSTPICAAAPGLT